MNSDRVAQFKPNAKKCASATSPYSAKTVVLNRRSLPARTVRRYNARPCLRVLPMNIQHHTRPRSHKVFVATLHRSSAEILRRQAPLLQYRPHSSVEHKYPFREQLSQSLGGFIQITHVRENNNSLPDFWLKGGYPQRTPRLGYSSSLRSLTPRIERHGN